MPAVFTKWWFWVLSALLIVIFFTAVVGGGEGRQEQPLTDFIQLARAGEVTSVEVDDNQLRYKLRGDGVTYETKMEEGDTVRQVLQDAGVQPEDFPRIELRVVSRWGNVIGIILQFLPVIFIIGTLYYFFRHARNLQSRSLLTGGVSEMDPVCGRRVSAAESAGSYTFQSITYRFCSPEHKQEFDSDPVKYLLEK